MMYSGIPVVKSYDYRWRNPFRSIRNFFVNLEYKRQRIKRGWCDQDTFSIDVWFLAIVPEMLQYMVDHSNSYPYDMSHEEWKITLREMIRLFNECNEESCSMKNEYSIVDDFSAWRERELKIIEYRDNCKNQAFELFSKYFFNLWD